MYYPIAIEPGDETHAIGVTVPDLPGCFSAGDTLDEAIANAEEAIIGWIDTTLDSDGVIPAPSSVDIIRKNPEFKNWVFAIVHIDPSKITDKIERINISLPRRALRRLDARAKAAGETRSGYIAKLALS